MYISRFFNMYQCILFKKNFVWTNVNFNYDLFRFQATDKDIGKQGKIQYSLRGNDAQDFIVNPETGTIYCTRPVDDSNVNKTFDVVAKDNEKSEGFESVLAITVRKQDRLYLHKKET